MERRNRSSRKGASVPFGFEWAPGQFRISTRWHPFSNDPKFLTATITHCLFLRSGIGQSSVQVPLDWENGFGSALQPTQDGFVALPRGGQPFRSVALLHAREIGDGLDLEARHALKANTRRISRPSKLSEDGKTIVYQYSTASKHAASSTGRSSTATNQLAGADHEAE